MTFNIYVKDGWESEQSMLFEKKKSPTFIAEQIYNIQYSYVN